MFHLFLVCSCLPKGCFGWMCTCVPRENFGRKQRLRPKRPQAEQYRKAARSQFLTCFKSFYRFLSGPKKRAFVQGFCCHLPWTCVNSWHLSWFLKVGSGVWICQNNSRGLYPKTCQAKGGLKLAPETFAVCTMKMDGRLGDYYIVSLFGMV